MRTLSAISCAVNLATGLSLSWSTRPEAYLLGASSFFVKPPTLPALKVLLHKIHDYWIECEVPEVDLEGYAIPTNSTGRLGARYTKPKR